MRRSRRWVLALGTALACLSVAAPAARAGMAELGRNGSDTSSGNGKVKLQVNPLFQVDVTAGMTVDTVLETLELQINDHPQQAWSAVHGAGTNVLAVVRKDGSLIDISFEVEGTTFPEAVTDTGFDRVRVDGTAGLASILPTDEPAGDGSVTVTLNGTPVVVSTSGHSSSSLLAALATAIGNAGFSLCPGVCGAASFGLTVENIHDIIWEDTDSGIDSFGLGLQEGVTSGESVESDGVLCNVAHSGSPTACDASDFLTIQFVKPAQKGNLDGFDLYGKALLTNPPSAFGPALFTAPVITGASCLNTNFGHLNDTSSCAATGSGGTQCVRGDLITIFESPIFVPGPKQVGYYNVTHSQVVGLGPAPADISRPFQSGTGKNLPASPRFFDPLCP